MLTGEASGISGVCLMFLMIWSGLIRDGDYWLWGEECPGDTWAVSCLPLSAWVCRLPLIWYTCCWDIYAAFWPWVILLCFLTPGPAKLVELATAPLPRLVDFFYPRLAAYCCTTPVRPYFNDLVVVLIGDTVLAFSIISYVIAPLMFGLKLCYRMAF